MNESKLDPATALLTMPAHSLRHAVSSVAGVMCVALAISVGPAIAIPGCATAQDKRAPAALAALPGLQDDDQQGDADDETALTAEQRSEINWLQSIFENPANEPRTRSGAALRLMKIAVAPALAPLEAALRRGDNDLILAVAMAMSETDSPPRTLLRPAVQATATATGPALDQLAIALTRFDAAAREMLSAVAHDQSLNPEERLGAIHALASFRSRAATVDLMALLEPARDEGEAIIAGTCRSLQRATGLPYGDDPQRWRQWWDSARDLPREQWLTNLVERLAEQLAQAEQQVKAEREATQQVQQRLGRAYRDLFPRLDLEEQLRALPGLLDDPLPALREFAIDRIARLLRDSVPIPREVQDKLAERLHDDVGSLRAQAARLLEQMNYDDLAVRLADLLTRATTAPDNTTSNGGRPAPDEAMIELALVILADSPSAAAFGAVVPLLTSPRHSERAAVALWEIINHGIISDEDLAAACSTGRKAEQWDQSAAHVRLLARSCRRDDLADIVPLMDGDEADLKVAVAAGLMRRGEVEPLLARVDDDAVYPFAVRAIALVESPWPALRQLLGLLPPPQHELMWREQVETLAGRLPHDRAMDADDLLSVATGIPIELRIAVLQRRLPPLPAVAGAPGATPGQPRNSNGQADQLPPELRLTLTLRLAELLLQANQPLLAMERLEQFAEIAMHPDAASLRFRALLRTEQYDLAQQLVEGPETWIAILERWAERRPDDAVALRKEIERRFDGQLTGEMQDQLEAVSERLPGNPPAAAPGSLQPVDEGESPA